METGCLGVGVSELLLLEDSLSSFCDCLVASDDAAFTGLSSSDDDSSLEEFADFLTATAIFLCLGRTLEEAPPEPLLLAGSLSLEELEELSSSAGCTVTTCLFFFLESVLVGVFFATLFWITDVLCSSSSELDSEDCFFFFFCLSICFSAFLFFFFEVIFSSVLSASAIFFFLKVHVSENKSARSTFSYTFS